MDFDKPRDDCPTSPCQLSNGFVLPQGKLTPNALFVGGIDMKADADEIREYFSRFGNIKDVKIIRYRGGICKGYGFVYFGEEVEIQTVIEKHVSFKGRKLKLGPAIMKERSFRTSPMPNRLIGPSPWASPVPYPIPYCTYCAHVVGAAPQALYGMDGGNPYAQPYVYSSAPGGIMVPISYAQDAYTYQYSPPVWPGGDVVVQPVNLGWAQ